MINLLNQAEYVLGQRDTDFLASNLTPVLKDAIRINGYIAYG